MAKISVVQSLDVSHWCPDPYGCEFEGVSSPGPHYFLDDGFGLDLEEDIASNVKEPARELFERSHSKADPPSTPPMARRETSLSMNDSFGSSCVYCSKCTSLQQGFRRLQEQHTLLEDELQTKIKQLNLQAWDLEMQLRRKHQECCNLVKSNNELKDLLEQTQREAQDALDMIDIMSNNIYSYDIPESQDMTEHERGQPYEGTCVSERAVNPAEPPVDICDSANYLGSLGERKQEMLQITTEAIQQDQLKQLVAGNNQQTSACCHRVQCLLSNRDETIASLQRELKQCRVQLAVMELRGRLQQNPSPPCKKSIPQVMIQDSWKQRFETV